MITELTELLDCYAICANNGKNVAQKVLYRNIYSLCKGNEKEITNASKELCEAFQRDLTKLCNDKGVNYNPKISIGTLITQLFSKHTNETKFVGKIHNIRNKSKPVQGSIATYINRIALLSAIFAYLSFKNFEEESKNLQDKAKNFLIIELNKENNREYTEWQLLAKDVFHNLADKLLSMNNEYINDDINQKYFTPLEEIVDKSKEVATFVKPDGSVINPREDEIPIIIKRDAIIYPESDFLNELEKMSVDEFNEICRNYSQLFFDILVCEDNEDIKKIIADSSPDGFIDSLCAYIRKKLIFSSRGYPFIRFDGDIGTHKEIFLQLLYECLNRNGKTEDNIIIPMYIDLDYCFRNELDVTDEKYAEDYLESMLSKFEKNIQNFDKYDNKKSILLLAGLKSFTPTRFNLEKRIKDFIDKYKVLLIVSFSCDFVISDTDETYNIIKNFDFFAYIRIKNVCLADSVACNDFIRKAGAAGYSIEGISQEAIYDCLSNMGVSFVDLGLLELLQEYRNYKLPDNINNFCSSFSTTAICENDYEKVWRFLYLNEQITQMNHKTSVLLNKHKIFYYYCVAKHFLKIISQRFNKTEIINRFDILNCTIPEAITIFLREHSDTCLNYIDKVIDESKDENPAYLLFTANLLPVLISDKKTKSDKKIKLINYIIDMVKKLENENKINFEILNFIKSIVIYSRAYLINDIDSDIKLFIEYMFKNKTAKETNHYFYKLLFGDIQPFIFYDNYDSIEFKDDIRTGEISLASLKAQLENLRYSNNANIENISLYSLLLFTYCSFLQSRIYRNRENDYDKLNAHISFCADTIRYIIENHGDLFNEDIKAFWHMLCDDFKNYKKEEIIFGKTYYPMNKAINQVLLGSYSLNNDSPNLTSIKNVHECSFTTLTIAVMFLPTLADDSNSSYNKQRVIDMLIIKNMSFCDEINILNLLYKDTYINELDLNNYKSCWKEYQTGQSINAKIASDIEIIYSCYSLLSYYCKNPDNIKMFPKAEIYEAKQQERNLKSARGKRIYYDLIIKNPDFDSLSLNI